MLESYVTMKREKSAILACLKRALKERQGGEDRNDGGGPFCNHACAG